MPFSLGSLVGGFFGLPGMIAGGIIDAGVDAIFPDKTGAEEATFATPMLADDQGRDDSPAEYIPYAEEYYGDEEDELTEAEQAEIEYRFRLQYGGTEGLEDWEDPPASMFDSPDLAGEEARGAIAAQQATGFGSQAYEIAEAAAMLRGGGIGPIAPRGPAFQKMAQYYGTPEQALAIITEAKRNNGWTAQTAADYVARMGSAVGGLDKMLYDAIIEGN